jgi:anti-sigma B factor antagonist
VSPRLEATSRPSGESVVIAIAGDADLTSVDEVQSHLDRAFEQGHTLLVVDLSEVGFVDSSFLHTLMRALRRARLSGGDIAVVCADPQICRMLEVFGLTTTVRIYEEVGEAAAALSAGSA